MDTEDSCGVQGGNVVGDSSVLDFGTLHDWCMLVRGVLWLGSLRVVKFDLEVGNVVVHSEPASAFDVVPLDIYARV